MGWISTEEKLPGSDVVTNEDIPCLVCYNGQIQILSWNDHYKLWDTADADDSECSALEVDYWMKLPAPPNTGVTVSEKKH